MESYGTCLPVVMSILIGPNAVPPRVPTDESAPLVVPDPHNPRLSYGAGKIISEMMVIRAERPRGTL